MPAHSALVPWGHLLGAIALETVLLFVVAIALQRFLRATAWRRTLWQVTLLGLGLIVAAEVSGARRLLVFAGSRESHVDSSSRVAFEISTSSTADLDGIAAKLKERGFVPIDPASAVPLNTDGAKAAVWWPAWVWLSGFAAVAIWMVGARLLFVFLVHRRPLNDEATRARVDALAGRLGLRRRVTVAETPGLAGPIAFGIFRPGISLPEGFSRRFTPVQQEAMLAHELAHLDARDPLWHALADALAALLWWHPVVWMARRQLRAASEAAADEASLLVENGPAALAECLVELGGRLTRARSLGWLGMEGGEFRSGLGRRVKWLVALPGQSWKPIRRTSDWLAKTMGVAALVALALAATAWLQPREARSDSFSQVFRESVLGLVLVAAMPVPQAENVAPVPPNGAIPAPENHPASMKKILHTRWFKIDPTTFGEALRGLLGTNAISSRTNRSAEAVLSDMQRIFSLAGVELSPPKQLFFNDRAGTLMVRATMEDLAEIEQAVQVLNTSPPQISFEVRLCEITEEAGRRLADDPVLGNGFLGSASGAIRTAATNGAAKSAQAILTPSQYRAVLETLDGQAGVDVLTAPKVTTLSGRQAQIKAVSVRYVVTDLDLNSGSSPPAAATDITKAAAAPGVTVGGGVTDGPSTIQPIAEPFELGPVIDLVPYVEADGMTISMTVIASIKEFLGYENMEGLLAAVKVGQQDPVTQVVPLPNFRLRQLMTSAKVLDGQTLVLAGGTSTFEQLGKTGPGPAEKGQPTGDARMNEPTGAVKKSLLVFVTPTLINAAGN